MARKSSKKKNSNRTKDESIEVLKSLLIAQLAMARVPAHSIRRIVGCSMNRVTGITKHLKKPKDE